MFSSLAFIKETDPLTKACTQYVKNHLTYELATLSEPEQPSSLFSKVKDENTHVLLNEMDKKNQSLPTADIPQFSLPFITQSDIYISPEIITSYNTTDESSKKVDLI